ncbi:MAG: hypothetical protein H0V56_12475 [Chthoniobacterales bacterium]|nr:hypothetical protein [Chthoniobacterales bacterium]
MKKHHNGLKPIAEKEMSPEARIASRAHRRATRKKRIELRQRGVPMEFGYHRALSKRFPFGVYYLVKEEVIEVYAVLDLRRDPAWIRRRLTATNP